MFAVLALSALSFVLGAAVMYFELPGSRPLEKAFIGARAWNERRQVNWQQDDREPPADATTTPIDAPGRTFDGYTLCTFASMDTDSTQAVLLDMRRDVVHRWAVHFSDVWPDAPQLPGRKVSDGQVCFFGFHLYPNGDLLVVFHGLEQLTTGYGLARLDKDSNVRWKYTANVHHDVDVGDDGTIYAIQHEQLDSPPAGLDFLSTPCLSDSIITLSPDGELRKKVSVLEALRDSPYAPLLATLGPSDPSVRRTRRLTGRSFDEAAMRQDALHTNAVRVLTPRLAPRFPQFKAGQVLTSMRHLDTVAVLDLDTKSVVWAARGPWAAQHDPQFLDTGRLLIFDNQGLPKGSRVLEYDPVTQAVPWAYPGPAGRPFYTSERGMSQRLGNGNTLVVNSEGGEVFEATPGGEVVWSYLAGRFVTAARRYAPETLTFLGAGRRARP